MGFTFLLAVPYVVPLFEGSQEAELTDTKYFTKLSKTKRPSNSLSGAQRASGHGIQSHYLSPHHPEAAGLLEQGNGLYKAHMGCTLGYESLWYWVSPSWDWTRSTSVILSSPMR